MAINNSTVCALCGKTYGFHYYPIVNGVPDMTSTALSCVKGGSELFSATTNSAWKAGDLAFVYAKKYSDDTYLLADTKLALLAQTFTHHIPCQVFAIDGFGLLDMEIMIEVDPSWMKANCSSGQEQHLGTYAGNPEYRKKFQCDPNTHYYWTSKECLVPRAGGVRVNHQEATVLCCQCGNGSPMSAPNLTTGGFCCWSCRQAYGWKYNKLMVKS